MAFLVIQTPRNPQGRPVLILPSSQRNNRVRISKIMQGIRRQAGVARSSMNPETGWLPIRTEDCLGVARSVSNEKGEPDLELYVLLDVDTAKLGPEAIQGIQDRLATQIANLAEPLITRRIRWENAKESHAREEFPAAGFVVRDDLNSLGMMFPNLPAGGNLKAAGTASEKPFNPFGIGFLVFLLVSGGILFGLQNYLPKNLQGISKMVGIFPVLLSIPLLQAKWYFTLLIYILRGHYRTLTAVMITFYFYLELLSASDPLAAWTSAAIAAAIAGATIWIVGMIFDTSTEAFWVRVVKFGVCLVITYVGLAFAVATPEMMKAMLVMAKKSDPAVANFPEPPPQTWAEAAPADWIPLVLRNTAEFDGASPLTHAGATFLLKVPNTDQIVGVTAKSLLDGRRSRVSPDLPPEKLKTALKKWQGETFNAKPEARKPRLFYTGLFGEPDSYKGHDILLLTRSNSDTPITPLDLSPKPPAIGDGLIIVTPFPAYVIPYQNPDPAIVLAYLDEGRRMLLSVGFDKPEGRVDITDFEGAPICNEAGQVVGVVIGAPPQTQRPYTGESSTIIAETSASIWELLVKQTKQPPAPPKTAGPAPAQTPQATPTPLAKPEFPNPFLNASSTQLKKEIASLRQAAQDIEEQRSALTWPNDIALKNSLDVERKLRKTVRRIEQVKAALQQKKMETKELDALKLAPIDPFASVPDLDELRRARPDVEKLRTDLLAARKSLDPKKSTDVEAHYDHTEAVNDLSKAFNQALERFRTKAPPPHTGEVPAPMPPPPMENL